MTAFSATLNQQMHELTTHADRDFRVPLRKSLRQAKEIARRQLNHELYHALPWPVNFLGYYKYLDNFARMVPQQSGDEVWRKPGTDENQEVYDRLCHFYWLINQEVPYEGTIVQVQSIKWFSEWLVNYAKAWGSFLDTTESFDQDILDSFRKSSPMYAVEDSMVNDRPNTPSGWLTFNQFFARELNPGLRPIASPTDNSVVTCPADCTFKATYPIGPDSTIPEIIVKKTHKFASIEDLLEDNSKYKSKFKNGVFAHYFLSPYSYHRFHAPVAGTVLECRPVKGLVYLDVNITGKQFDAPDRAEGGYEFAQARGIITLDTKDSPYGDIGLVTTIPVGMCQVSSVNMTATVDAELLKGDEFGYFTFGGSDIIVLLQAGAIPDKEIDENGDYRHYGTPIFKPKNP